MKAARRGNYPDDRREMTCVLDLGDRLDPIRSIHINHVVEVAREESDVVVRVLRPPRSNGVGGHRRVLESVLRSRHLHALLQGQDKETLLAVPDSRAG